VSNVIDFLERFGWDAGQGHAASEALAEALKSPGIEPALRAALLDMNVRCSVPFAIEDDEDDEELDEDDEDEDEDEDDEDDDFDEEEDEDEDEDDEDEEDEDEDDDEDEDEDDEDEAELNSVVTSRRGVSRVA
jgi:hypothetical protein